MHRVSLILQSVDPDFRRFDYEFLTNHGHMEVFIEGLDAKSKLSFKDQNAS